MSIQSEIERISQAKTDIHSAIESKGVTVPDDTLISEMAPYIQQIREAGTVVTSVSYIEPDESGNAQLENLKIYCGDESITYNGGAEQALTINPETVGAATAEQGALADTAVQPAQIAKFITAEDIPDELPNPHALSIQLNGGSTTTYDGSAIKNVNITPAAIGAAATSDLEALKPLVGSLSTITPTQINDALAQNRQCIITASYQGTTYLITSWNRYNITGTSTYYVAGSYIENISNNQSITVFCVTGYTSSSGWTYSETTGLLYTGQPRTSDSEFLTATISGGLVLEEISATSIGGAPTMHSSTDTTYGVGTSSNYGHVRLSDSITSTSDVSSGIAATPNAIKQVNDSVPIVVHVNMSSSDWSYIPGTGDMKWLNVVYVNGITEDCEIFSVIPVSNVEGNYKWSQAMCGADELVIYSNSKENPGLVNLIFAITKNVIQGVNSD